MTFQDELRQLQAIINEQVLGSPKITNPAIKNRGITIERADKKHAGKIAKWAGLDEPRFIGVESGSLNAKEVNKWIDEAIGAYVLVGSSNELLAFANVAPVEPSDLSRIEIGRLLVDPGNRRQGFGSTLVRNLCLAIGAAYKVHKPSLSIPQSITLSRVIPDNSIGIEFIQTLPFTKLEDGPDTKHQWYEYFLNRRNNRLLGEKMVELRNKLHMSQAKLAFLCGVQRETINMIESGSRTASLELLWAICRVLGRNQINRAALLLAAIGEEVEISLRQYETVTNALPDIRQNIWVATDEMAESSIDAYYEGTKQAIMNGFDRYFFMPKGQWEKEGESLKDRLQTDLGSSDKAKLDRHFRFYEAPEWLCYFRVVVANPTERLAVKITVGGEDYTRFPLTETQSSAIFKILNIGVKEADVAAAKTDRETASGFRRWFPLMKGGTK